MVAVLVRQFVESPSMVTKAYELPGDKAESVPHGAIYVRSLRKPETRLLQSPDDLRELVRVASLREQERYFKIRALERQAGSTDAAAFHAQLGGWDT